MKNIFLLMLLFTGMVKAQIVNIPDANFKAALLSASETNQIAKINGVYSKIDTNNNGEIEMSEAVPVTYLNFRSGMNIHDLTGINSFTNLETLGCFSNPAAINIDGLNSLGIISISGSVSNTPSVFSNLPALVSLSFNNSYVNSISVTNAPNIEQASVFANPNLTTLLLDDIPALKIVAAWDCNISNFSISNSPLLENLDFQNNRISSISLPNSPLVKELDLTSNQITSLAGLTNMTSLKKLWLGNNPIVNTNLWPMPNLEWLTFNGNASNNIDFAAFPNLEILTIHTGNLTVLDITHNSLLKQLFVEANPISVIDLSQNTLMYDLNISNAPLTTLDFSNMTVLHNAYCRNLLVSELDFSHNPALRALNYSGNPNLTHVNLKNGVILPIVCLDNWHGGLPNLSYICIDDGDALTYPSLSTPPMVPQTSYCSFVPGGNYNTITGNMKFDSNNNGCDAGDITPNNIRVNINDGTIQGASFTNAIGNYTFYTQAGSFDITPSIENPTWFNFSPVTATIPFADNNNNTVTQDFCISSNGFHPDVEVVISPVFFARPGFDATYQITYKNKGNQTFSEGLVSMQYNDAVLDFVSASQATFSQAVGNINWQYTNLLPFESRSITVTLNVNSPTETPAVNIGDLLNFIVSTFPSEVDENPEDNTFSYVQTVVGSYDPNDITCLEGDVVAPSEIGNYLHYAINFENTGTFPAENVVVKTEVDASKFDIGSLQLMNTNFPVDARISGNKVEFIFENIQLPIGGHGHILLKIKTNETLVVGDAVANRADIFFDYNFPIDTGLANTVFQNLSNSVFEVDGSIAVYPNPAVDNVTVNADNKIKSIELYDAQGRIIMASLIDDLESKLDISSYSKGIYFLKITTEKGAQVQKLLKD